jgi:hypothetical protein
MRHETKQRLLAEFLALFDVFYEQLEYAIAVVEDLREAVA